MSKTRQSPAINAGSMADIAFLLLIFFLTTTSIYNDKGLSVTLPPFYDGPVGGVASKNVGVIRINEAEKILLEGEIIEIKQIKEAIKDFITNPMASLDRPASPKKAVISIQHDANINYQLYMEVYAEIKAAYRELYEDFSLRNFGSPFSSLDNGKKNEVRKAIPLTISEAEYKL